MLLVKKNLNSPQQQTTTPPPNPNDTTGNNTNDTVGKVKIFYKFITTPLTIGYGSGVSGRDYVQDTVNTRILHNGIKLFNHKVTTSILPYSIGLNSLENCSTPTPVWCAIGDTITLEIDSNEVNFTSGATSDRFLHTVFNVWKSAPGNVINANYHFDTHNYSAYPDLEAIYQGVIVAGTAGYNNYLGTANNTASGLPQSFYIGGKLTLRYIVQ